MSKRPATRAACRASAVESKRTREPSPPPQCTIDYVPDEMLARIFHELPCWELFKVGRVSHHWRGVVERHGWTNVGGVVLPNLLPPGKRFRGYSALLDRCGVYLEWLTLKATKAHHLALLHRCPNIHHLQLTNVHYLPQTLDTIRELRAGKIKSLALDFCPVRISIYGVGADINLYHADEVAALNELFNDGTAMESLEFLRFTSRSLGANKIHFPEQLRCLQLYRPKPASGRTTEAPGAAMTHQFLSQLNSGSRFTHLRSLDLVVNEPMPLVSSLEHLPQLEHLTLCDGWRVDTATVAKLTQTLLQLTNLKSLVLTEGTRLLEAVTRGCPQLEHLGFAGAVMGNKSLLKAVGNLLTQLRSLETSEWELMEALLENGSLEYLNLNVAIPVRLLYEVIRKSPKLQLISVYGKYNAEKIANAAAEAQALAGDEVLPTIYCILTSTPSGDENQHGRVVIQDRRYWKAPKSPVLQHYRYGCLSEGEPKWEGER